MTPGKRCFDIAFSMLLLALLALPFLVLCAVLLLWQGRPVFHISERMKTPTQPFDLWKLRTMDHVADDLGASGPHKAHRITPAGRFLRRYRIDEIPQLWNVLRGDMSMVGPRPPLRRYVAQFPVLYAQVLTARPGITGLASLVYHRHEAHLLARCGDAEANEDMYRRACVPRKGRLDLIYLARYSGWLDLWIIAKTLRAVFSRGKPQPR